MSLPDSQVFNHLSDDAFWAWLTGFSDGEACFSLRCHMSKNTRTYSPIFVIGLRADDWRLLSAIRTRTGLGFVRGIPTPKTRPLANPMASWSVARNSEQESLVCGFRRVGSLFSKKRRDFELWARAIRLISLNGGGSARSKAFEELAEIKAQLHDLKKYDAVLASGWDSI